MSVTRRSVLSRFKCYGIGSVAWTTDSQTLCLLVLHYVQKQTTYRPDENATVSTRGDVVRPTHDANIWRASKNCKQRAGDGRGPCDKSQNKPPQISSKAERQPKRRSLGDRGGHNREQGLFRRVGLAVYPAEQTLLSSDGMSQRCQERTPARGDKIREAVADASSAAAQSLRRRAPSAEAGGGGCAGLGCSMAWAAADRPRAQF
jgi:hypothetical protein